LLAERVKTGELIEAPATEAPAAIPDLMAALRASLGGGSAHGRTKKPAAKSAHTKRAPQTARTRHAAHRTSKSASRGTRNAT
jgi:hypothetical protein